MNTDNNHIPFEIEYDLKIFREEEKELFESKSQRYSATRISDDNAILMLKIIDGFENHSIQMKERIKELEELIKSDSVYSLLRFGFKSPSQSGMDNFNDNNNIKLYEMSSILRNATKKCKSEYHENDLQMDGICLSCNETR